MSLREKERTKGAARRVESLRLIPQPQEDLLGDVFGLRLIIDDSSGEPKDRTTMTAVDFCQRDLVVAGDQHHEMRVAGLAEITHISPIRCRRDFGCRDDLTVAVATADFLAVSPHRHPPGPSAPNNRATPTGAAMTPDPNVIVIRPAESRPHS